MKANQPLSEILDVLQLFQPGDQVDLFWKKISAVQSPTVVSFANSHAINLAYKNQAFLSCLTKSDILLRDGSGTKLMLMYLGMNPGLNMNGTDLIPQIMAKLKDKRYAIYGTEEPWLSKSIATISATNNVIDSLDGFHPDAAYVEHALKSKPEVIILAMGMPKQEMVSILLKQNLQHPCLIINGGAILDFISQRFPRAPHWIRQIGFEWLFRFSLEPKRLFKRYMIGNFIFFKHVISHKKLNDFTRK